MTNNKHLVIVILLVLILIISVKLYTCEKVNVNNSMKIRPDL